MSRRRLQCIASLLAAGASFALSACSFEVVATQTDPPLLVMKNRHGGTDGLVIGQVQYLRDASCFVIARQDVPERSAAVWPEGTKPITRDDGTVGVDVPGVGEIIEGEWIYAGGGYHSDGEPHELPDVPPECLSSYGEYVFIERLVEVSTEPIAPPGVTMETPTPEPPSG